MKKTVILATVIMAAVGLCGCGKDKNVAPQANINKNENETRYPEDTRPGMDTNCEYPGDWNAVTYVDGNSQIPYEAVEKYIDTGVTIEVCFYLEDTGYNLLGVACSDNWDEKLYAIDRAYIGGVTPHEEAFGQYNVPLYYVSIQDDGYFSFAPREIHDHKVFSFTFELTSDAIKFMAEKHSKDKGIVMQTYGVTVTKVIIDSQPIDALIE